MRDKPVNAVKTAAKPTRVRYVVLGGLSLATLIAYIHRNSIGVAEMEIRDELGLTMQEMGWVMSAFFLTYAIAQLPTAALSQSWGTRRALPIFSVLGALALWLGTLAVDLPMLLASRLGLGLAQAGMLPAATNSVRHWLPRTQRAFASGVVAASLSVGGALGTALTGTLLVERSWRFAFAVFALPSLLWALWFAFWFRNRPQEHPGVNLAELRIIGAETVATSSARVEPTPWLGLAWSPAMWCICGQQVFRAAGYMFYASWFATFLQEARHVTLKEAGLLNSMPLLGVVLGSITGGILSDAILMRTGSRRFARQGVAIVSLLASALFILLARPIETPWLAVLLITAGSFASSIAGPCSYAITMDMGGKHVATVFSTMNMSGNIGALGFPLLVPLLVGKDKNWDLVLVVFAGIHLVAAGCWLLLNPRGTIFDRHDVTEHGIQS